MQRGAFPLAVQFDGTDITQHVFCWGHCSLKPAQEQAGVQHDVGVLSIV